MTIDAAELELVVATAQRIARDGADPADVWESLVTAELVLLAVPEPEGGGSLAAAAAVARILAAEAAAVPYADTALVALPLLADAGLPVPRGAVAVAVDTSATATREADGWRVRGDLRRVPWAGRADRILLVAGCGDTEVLASLDARAVEVVAGTDLAGDPRDTVRVDLVVPERDVVAVDDRLREQLVRRGALARAVTMAGAADAALRASARYAAERVQFGRPIAKQQAVQHGLAEMAAEVAAMRAAADAAVEVCTETGFAGDDAQTAVAVAKSQAGLGAEVVARIAHQVHGAIGTTQEHPLHRFTTRLWSWRDEFGSERHWDAILGRVAIADDPWEVVTR